MPGQRLVISECNFCLPSAMSVFGVLYTRVVAEPALSSCWKYTMMPGQTCCHLEDTKLWQGQHFCLVESINSVAKASRSTNSAFRASILSSGRHQSCRRASRASTFIMLEVPTVLPGPTSCHLADMKLVTRPPLFFCGKYQQCCQGQHLAICKTFKLLAGSQSSNVSSRRHQTCGRVMPGPATCHLLVQFMSPICKSVFGIFDIRTVAEPALSSCWKTQLPGPPSCHLEDTKIVARTTLLSD